MKKRQDIIALIPARAGSKRIKNKNIKKFCGEPIIAHTINEAKKSKIFDEIVVSTDSKKIASIAKRYGAKIPFLRPKNFSNDKTPVRDVVIHYLDFLKNKHASIKYICLIYPTAPFILKKDLLEGLKKIKKKNIDFVLAISKYKTVYSRSLKIHGKNIIPITKKDIFRNSQDCKELYYDCGQFVFGKSISWKRYKSALLAKTTYVYIPSYRSEDINTLEDWVRAENLYKNLKKFKNIYK